MPKSNEMKRLRWGCRRGMLELDIILLPFFDNHFQQLTPQQQQTFAALLTEQDQQLYTWFIGTEVPDNQEVIQLINLIKQNVVTSH